MKLADRDFEISPLSGIVKRDGMSIEVMIFRTKNCGEKWRLEVVNKYGTPTKWTRRFASDRDACIAFLDLVDAGGFIALAEAAPDRTRQ